MVLPRILLWLVAILVGMFCANKKCEGFLDWYYLTIFYTGVFLIVFAKFGLAKIFVEYF